jgi:hypothetical protein
MKKPPEEKKRHGTDERNEHAEKHVPHLGAEEKVAKQPNSDARQQKDKTASDGQKGKVGGHEFMRLEQDGEGRCQG